MKKLLFLFVIFIPASTARAQTPTAAQLLEKSIRYHDPQGRWGKEMLTLHIEESRPKSVPRTTALEIDLPNDLFKMTQQRDANRILRIVKNGECAFLLNESNDIPADTLQKLGLTCERTISTRNYYTYLWGLPMKLKDPGMILNDTVQTVDFFGKPAYQLKVTYDPKVGSDVWFFYFNPDNAALIGYKFYHNEAKKDGEYILLEEEATVNGMKLPRIRKWYWNQSKEFIGTDTLVSGK
jgi:hypothetical protein